VQAGQKKQPSKGGIFFPIPAVQVGARLRARFERRLHWLPPTCAGPAPALLRRPHEVEALSSVPHHPLQKFDPVTKDFENGVFLGPIASLTFNGPYTMAGRQLSFDVRSMNIGLGPWRWSIALKKDAKPLDQLPDS
jgi:hypothetical protein